MADQNKPSQPPARVLSRRQAIAFLGAGGAVALGALAPSGRARAQSLPSCVATPQQTEGPYFVDEKLRRADIRADSPGGAPRPGLPLQLTLQVSQLGGNGCTPLPGALVDVWHCDAAGLYSDVSDGQGDTRGSKFLRGQQVAGADGLVRFTTIYPGWYPGRAVHIHFKLRAAAGAGRAYEFTSQLYFDEAVSDRVLARAPYIAKGKQGTQGTRTRNETDGLYRRGGKQLMLALSPSPSGEGYNGHFHIALTV
jgi:protocatechuate 3,4-dioxygenase beta subunit